jgi:hypothetical protein
VISAETAFELEAVINAGLGLPIDTPPGKEHEVLAEFDVETQKEGVTDSPGYGKVALTDAVVPCTLEAEPIVTDNEIPALTST